MILRYKKRFIKHFDKLSSSSQQKVDDTLVIFKENPFYNSLRNHALHSKKYDGCRSLDVTGDLRIIFRELSDGEYELVELLDL
jgi:mRNA-degrading endonuclease YafQ of YafQ-DinJ toxin-antitoxin module